MQTDEHRRAATYPLPHPHGWYQLVDSAQVRAGQVVEVAALGESWAVFRSDAGRIGVLHATCPHLGANLADGRVDGDCLTCPFHGWRFSCDGHLRTIPGVDRIPRARADAPIVREIYGMVVMWHGPVDDAGEPPYEPDAWPDLASDTWVRRGTWLAGDIAMHPLEFCENAVDDAHFASMHGQLMVPWTRIPVPGVHIEHTSHWTPDAERPFASHFVDDARLTVAGRTLPRSEVRGHGTFLGPASLVGIRVTVPDAGDVMIGHTHTPVGAPGDPLQLRVRFTWWSERRVPAALAWYIAGSWVSQWRNDVDVWERKAHVRRPTLCEADGEVHALRRWFSQFYDDATAQAWLGRSVLRARRTA